MTIEEIFVSLTLPPPATPRSEGVHVSNIIRCIATEMGILKKEWAEEIRLTDVREITDPIVILRMSIGLAWESWYIPQILGPKGVIDHPQELCIDGIYASPDAESVDSVIITNGSPRWEQIVHEVKATYKSSKQDGRDRDMTKEWMWLTQIKAYCKGLGTRFARLHVLYICGDYSYPIRPILKEYAIEFEQEEIDRSWELLLDYAKDRM